jgi:hypothetical protein
VQIAEALAELNLYTPDRDGTEGALTLGALRFGQVTYGSAAGMRSLCDRRPSCRNSILVSRAELSGPTRGTENGSLRYS